MTGSDHITVFLSGDVMTGRGIDQILPYPSPPELQESYVRDAREYVELAEQVNGTVIRPVDFRYIWGDALGELDRASPDARIINLETSVTISDTYWPGKGIHYRMHPRNVPCLTAARTDVCTLANNHVLDYGYTGLEETLRTLEAAAIQTVGAGLNLDQARRPAIFSLPADRRVIVFSFGTEISGIPPEWAATPDRPGVDRLDDLSASTASEILDRVRLIKRRGDVVIASIHWGSNWGFDVPPSHVRFAHRLLDGEVDLVHGHSSHHPRPMEVYNHKLVLYGCGDFLNDYEGISGYDQFRAHLTVMYFPTIDSRTGELVELRMTPMQIRRLQVVHASPRDARWLRDVLTLASQPFDAHVELDQEGRLALRVHVTARR